MIDLKFDFRTPEQEQFFALRCRNECFSGGFGNGKTFGGCQKVIYLASTFPKYRVGIFRFEQTKLRETTMKTFFNVCPPPLYDPKYGGNRADSLNKCTLINGSEIIFMHLKDVDETIVRGLELNAVLIDQAEEISEYMYLMLSARVGRWSYAEVPQYLLDQNPSWPKKYDKPLVPNYLLLLCNPDSELHWIYKRYHPESEDWKKKFHRNHFMVQGETTVATVDEELLEEMKENDKTWVDRFVRGKWGIPGGAIHSVSDESILRVGKDIDLKFVETIIKRGNCSRILDHGDSAPTCCLWASSYKGQYFIYREYYKGDTLISEHRRTIGNLSNGEDYISNIIDPACCKKTMQKYGGRWSVQDEYVDPNIDAEKIYFTPGDNDELSTRNRISELLTPQRSVFHPVTGVTPAPKLYFIIKSEEYPNGCDQVIRQTKAQKREKVGTIDGKDIFSDERDSRVTDHAYDPLRYYCASHSLSPSVAKPKLPPGSMGWIKKQLKMYKLQGSSPYFENATNA